jgi:hypothetical protein
MENISPPPSDTMNVGLHLYLDIIHLLNRDTAKYDNGFNQVFIHATPVIRPFDKSSSLTCNTYKLAYILIWIYQYTDRSFTYISKDISANRVLT